MEQSWKSILTTALLVVGMPLMAAAASSAPEGVPSLESPASAMAPIVRRPSAEGPKDMRKGPAVHRSRIRVSPAVAEAMRKETKATLRKGFRLLGKTDAQAAGAFRGGKENYSADGQTLLGRVYNVPVFGEMRQAATIYDRDGKVENVTIQMEGPRTMRYDRILRKLYGNPSYVQPVPGEGGATWQEWDVGVHTVRLYQGYGLPALELRNRPDRREGIPANQVWQPVREAWLPAGVTLTAGSRKPLPALEEALRDYYGLDREAWAKTDYRYNAVDLNGDGTQECFVVVAGPSRPRRVPVLPRAAQRRRGRAGNRALRVPGWPLRSRSCRRHCGRARPGHLVRLVRTPPLATVTVSAARFCKNPVKTALRRNPLL